MKKSPLAKLLPYLMAPLLTGLFLLPVFWIFELYPLGRNTLAWCDMRQQVVPLWMQLKDVMSGEVDWLYSFRAAGGMTLWGVLLFFVASPLSLPVVLWEKGDLLLFANLVTILKMMLCSVGALWFFRRRHPGLDVVLSVLLSVCYALSGYAMLFYQNSIWLDMMALFPFLYLSLESLCSRGKGASFTFWLTLCIAVNYYLSYALLLFVLFAAAVFCRLRFDGADCGRFALRLGCHTAIALLLTAPVWLPSLLEVMASARAVNVVASIAQGGLFTHFYTVLPFLWCSAAAVAGLLFLRPAHCADPRDRSERILLGLMLVAMLIDPINKVWHTGSYQAFPVRYGFIPVLLLLSLAAGSLSEEAAPPSGCPGAQGAGVGALLAAVAVSGGLLAFRFEELGAYTRSLWGDRESFVLLTSWAAAVFGAAAVLIYLRRQRKLSPRAFSWMFALLVAVQSIFSAAVYIGSAAHSGGYLPWITGLEGRIADEDFYRVKTSKKLFDVNLLGGIGYNNMAHYTSLTREDYLFAVKTLGYSAYWMEVGSHGGTVLTDALLNNRYTIRLESRGEQYARQVYNNRAYAIMESAFQLPFGLVTPASPEAIAALPGIERARVGEWALNTLLGRQDSLVTKYAPSGIENAVIGVEGERIAVKIDDPAEDAVFTFHIAAEQPTMLYLDCFDETSTRLVEAVNASLRVSVNGTTLASAYPSQRENGLLELGFFEQEPVEVVVQIKKDFTARSFGVFGVDTQALSGALAAARGGELGVSGRGIEGRAQARGDGELLFLSIPYSEGWTAEVNGRETPVLRVLDSFMAVALEPGENTLSMRFFPLGMKTALRMMAAGAALAAFCGVLRRQRRGCPAALEKTALGLLWLCAAAGFLAAYLLPVLLHLFA
jgi:hypothetical protein